jgi:RNA polymerase sigma factor (sigma-70 family)
VTDPEDVVELRPLLFSIAYRMLGSVADAEDIVQAAYLRYLDYGKHGHEADSPRALLTAITTRLAIDQLRSARVRRETYIGPWLPEPLLTSSEPDVAEAVVMSDSLSMAFLVLLETLSPVERAVFLLCEVFAYDYDDVARIVGKSESNCRQLLARSPPRGRRPATFRDGLRAACRAGRPVLRRGRTRRPRPSRRTARR